MVKRIGVTIPLLFGIVVLSIAGVSAQSLAKSVARSGATVSDRIIENYLDLNSASQKQRPEIFSNLYPGSKAGVFRFHLAFQLVKRPGLSCEQKELILEAMSGIRAESYDRSKPESLARAREASKLVEQNATSMFSKKDAYEIFASLTADKSDANLIRKYVEITALRTMDERRAIFNRSTSGEKSGYWRVHFAYCLAKYTELNPDQQKIIVDAIDLVKPEMYEIGKSHPNRQIKVEIPISELSGRVLTAFSKDIGSSIFIKLGDGSGPTVEQQAKCNCALDSIPSCWDEICQSYSCSVTAAGCGVFWVWLCDGRCPPRPRG